MYLLIKAQCGRHNIIFLSTVVFLNNAVIQKPSKPRMASVLNMTQPEEYAGSAPSKSELFSNFSLDSKSFALGVSLNVLTLDYHKINPLSESLKQQDSQDFMSESIACGRPMPVGADQWNDNDVILFALQRNRLQWSLGDKPKQQGNKMYQTGVRISNGTDSVLQAFSRGNSEIWNQAWKLSTAVTATCWVVGSRCIFFFSKRTSGFTLSAWSCWNLRIEIYIAV